jgi:hypothetical protein
MSFELLVFSRGRVVLELGPLGWGIILLQMFFALKPRLRVAAGGGQACQRTGSNHL